MRSVVRCIVTAVLLAAAPGFAAAASADAFSVEGRVRQPQHFDLEALSKLPAEHVEVSFAGERGTTKASFTGVRLWAVLDQAGGIDDPDERASLHHIVKVTAKDGYFVILSTGEIAPDFGAKPAIVAYQRDEEPAGQAGFRLVMPGDKRGGRNVREIVKIDVE